MDEKTFKQLAELKSEFHILAQAAMANGLDPIAVFSTMFAGTFELGKASFEYNGEKLEKFLVHVHAQQVGSLKTPEFQNEKAKFKKAMALAQSKR